jgi:hypothetical protein
VVLPDWWERPAPAVAPRSFVGFAQPADDTRVAVELTLDKDLRSRLEIRDKRTVRLWEGLRALAYHGARD